jgi:hypothetical protein
MVLQRPLKRGVYSSIQQTLMMDGKSKELLIYFDGLAKT